MENNKKSFKDILTYKNATFFLIGLVAGLLVVGTCIFTYQKNFSNNNKNNSESSNEVTDSSSDNNNIDNNNNDNGSTVEPTDNNNESSNNTVTPTPAVTSTPVIETPKPVVTATPTVTSVPDSNGTKFSNENEVVNYFSQQEKNITTYNDENNGSFRESVKNTFVSIVDFVFYDGTIGGYKFKDLTTSAKLTILKIAFSIDNKIDSYFPNYKDGIKATFSDLKSKVIAMYLEYTAKLCETVGSNTCNQAREDFKNMKASFGFTFDILKNLGTNATSAIKEWYEIFRSE